MDREQAKNIIINTFENHFSESNYVLFLKNLLKSFEENRFSYQGNYIPDAFKRYISSFERIGKYVTEDKEVDLLIVQLQKETSLERARTMQRNFVAWYLKGSRGGKLKDAALVAFVSPDSEDWRFSLVKMDYRFEETPSGKVKVEEEFTPARRWSFLVGRGEKSHTAQSRFLELLQNDEHKPTLQELEAAFSIEQVTEEFFDAYRYALNEIIIKSLSQDFPYEKKHSFAQQLLSRILFIYFLQRKGWLKWKNYKQDKNYIRNLWLKYKSTKSKNTFYSQWLSSLFFGAFNKKSHLINPDLPDEIKESFILMPFLNGGLFTKNELDKNDFLIPDSVFEWLFEPDESSSDKKKGFLEIFNFTIDETSPIDVEVAVDPEMLGKVYESLINEEERGRAGIFYTPRVEIDFMCRLALVNYLQTKTQIDKQDLITLIFNPESINSYSDTEKLIALRDYLHKVKIVDPAVGSASFLVGMMNILVELHSALTRKLENKEENLFALKHKIILENLYGVDVKDWAVMVGELRLWLSLIIETDEKYMDIYTKPLLPNLSFKIRQGDSLVEEVGGIFINLRGDALKTIPNSIKQKISDLIDKKAEFFSGKRSADLKEQIEIENLEIEIFKEILQTKIDDLSKKLSSKNQSLKQLANSKNLFGETGNASKQEQKKLSEEIDQLKIELSKYQSALSAVGTKGKKDYFLWELDFAEVFAQNGGFDIVIGNPPYVRQELIAPPLENEKDYSADNWRKLKSQYKDKLIQATQNVWRNISKIDKKSDLYVFFYYQGLSLLNDNGIFCFINSNSWLDVGYGTGLQEFLLKNMKPLYIIDNIAKRSFKQADVNTVIVFIQKPKEKPDDFTLKFIAFKKPFEEVITPEVLKDIENTTKPVFDHPMYRVYPKTKKELLEEGVEYPDETELKLIQNPEQLHYIGNKWGGKYLRAPEIYFKILEKGKDKFEQLYQMCNVEGYIHDNNTGPKFSEAKFVKSIKQLESILLSSDSKAIIMYGVKTDGNSRLISPILFPRTLGNRQLIVWNKASVYAKEFYKVIPNSSAEIITIVAQLNSTFGILQRELFGLTNLGDGALKFSAYDIGLFYLCNDLQIDEKNINNFFKRAQYDIITELGFDPSRFIREQEPNPLPDRKELDDIVFDALGLTEAERKEVYWAVAELVKARLDKAKSV